MSELEASRKRMNAKGLRLAIRVHPLPTAQIIKRGRAVPEGFVEWTADEMFHYLELEPMERRILRDMKMRYPGQTTFVRGVE